MAYPKNEPQFRPFHIEHHRGNMGEIVYREQHPADPLKDEATRKITHRGGLGDARTEHY